MAHRHLTEREQQVALPTDRQRLPDRAERTFDHREIPASAPKRTTPVSQSAAGRRGVSNYQRSLVWDIEPAFRDTKDLRFGMGEAGQGSNGVAVGMPAEGWAQCTSAPPTGATACG